MAESESLFASSDVVEKVLCLEIRSHDGRLITQWPIEVGEDASEIDVNAELAFLCSPYDGDKNRSWAEAILAGDS